MVKRGPVNKVLAIAGSLLVWFPLLTPVIVSVIAYAADGIWRFDYLIPAELFPAALLGSSLLLWAALRAHARRRLIGAGIGIAAVSLFGGQFIAIVTGLASGEIEPGGWQLALVLASIIVYVLALVCIGIGGILLLRDLFKSNTPTIHYARV